MGWLEIERSPQQTQIIIRAVQHNFLSRKCIGQRRQIASRQWINQKIALGQTHL